MFFSDSLDLDHSLPNFSLVYLYFDVVLNLFGLSLHVCHRSLSVSCFVALLKLFRFSLQLHQCDSLMWLYQPEDCL